ncbi:MAG TPA: sigma 54-interacting transcriptional regulator [Thermoanaerobaculia bacterium]|nr:sigma 54-interacting transcriptional regulator [Thermoanaerobaculia bacterium]
MTTETGANILESLEAAQRRGIEGLGRKAVALERLLAISQEISTLDLPTALRRILLHVLELTGTRRGALLLGETAAELHVELALDLERGELPADGLAVSRSVAEQALTTGEVIVVENAPASVHGARPSVVRLRLQALLAIPLKARDRSLGVIYLDTDLPQHAVHRLDASILAAFGSQAAIALENARLHQQLQDEHFLLRRSLEESFRFDEILYRSPAMHRVCQSIRQVMASDVTVLISGETGTGKELVARAIHHNGPRKDKRFLGQNAGALPENLLESELFGHRRGAFSGAVENKVGLFEAADGGTVFLDEIGEASPALQVRLLRLLETGTFRRVGETVDRRADVRVIAATNRDLAGEVRAGRFRADLYYRLSVFPIHLPPLRERREDIEVLVPHFVERFNRELGRTVRTIPHAVLADLARRDWPGNVRELQNTVQRLVLLSSGEELTGLDGISAAPPPPVPQTDGPSTDQPFPTLESVEREHVRRALEQAGGNLSQAARLLGLNRSTRRWRLKRLNVDL